MTAATCLLVSIPLGIVAEGKIRRLRGIARLRFFLKEAPLATLVFIAVLYLAEFQYLYEAVPHSLGGGQPAIVRIVAKPGEQRSLRVMGMEFPAGSSVSEPVKLLLSTPENYVLSVGEQGSLAEVPRDLVKAILYGQHRAQDTPAGRNGS